MKWKRGWFEMKKRGSFTEGCSMGGIEFLDTGEIIKFLRKRENLTQQELADMLGVQKSSVQKYENGSVQNLKLETIQKLCEIFQVAPYAFVYPDIWEEYQRFYEGDSTIHELKALYTILTKEGRQKTLSYMEDLSKIKQYVREDMDKYIELEKLFPWLSKTNGRH